MEIVLISGHGELPVLLAARLKSNKASFSVYSIKGFENPSLEDYKPKILEFEKLGSFLKELKRLGVKKVCFSGNIVRPVFNMTLVDSDTIPLIPVLMNALKMGDDKALKIIISIFEDSGFKLIGAHQICPELLVSEGLHSEIKLADNDHEDIKRAKEVIAKISSIDIGQSCIVSLGQVLSVETIGGTDRMIESLSINRPKSALYNNDYIYSRDPLIPSGGILYKSAKVGQELRVDMPVVGPRTFLLAKKNGLRGIVITKGNVMVLDKEKCISLANSLGLFFLVVK
ncbi:MAG: LpxI family protein [Paracoccaceae bacterium]